MSTTRFLIAVLFAASVTGLHAQAPKTAELGTITFPTSAKPAAQGPFLTGVKALYNFEFDTAAEAFRQAQKADPAFALGYWGEAMSFNHPLWAQQDLAAARKVMERLAPTAAERAAKAPAGKERELIEAQEILFGAGDRHITAEQLHAEAVAARVPVSLATVYNTLNQFTEAGLLREVAIEGDRTYFDTNTSNHYHYYVEHEGRLFDIESTDLAIKGLPEPPPGMEVGRIDIIVRLKARQN